MSKTKNLDTILTEVNEAVVYYRKSPDWKWGTPTQHKAVKLEAVQTLYSWAAFAKDEVKTMREEAIKRGHAQYNPTTAEFEWL